MERKRCSHRGLVRAKMSFRRLPGSHPLAALDTKSIAAVSEPDGLVQQILSVRHTRIGAAQSFSRWCLTDKSLFVSAATETLLYGQ
jgi:hypothetical protein